MSERTGGQPTVAEALGAMIADRSRPLGADALEVIDLGVIDALACAIAGSREDICRRAQRPLSPVEDGALVFGTTDGAGPAQAALLNGIAGHALEFDDWEIPGNSHPSIVLVPAILAVAPARLSGPELARAYACGFEVIARVGESINFDHYDRGWHTTASLGALGAAGAAAATLGLDATGAAHAVALACSRPSGLTAQFGSDAKPLQAGFAAEAGVTAALLAAEGLTARLDVFESPRGYGAITADADPARFTEPMSRIADPWAIAEHGLVLKSHPTCGYTHRIVDAVIEIRKQMASEGLRPEHVDRITVRLPELHASILPFMHPTSIPEARFSLPFAVSTTLLDGRITLDDLTSHRWTQPDVASLMQRCVVEPFAVRRPELNYDPDDPDVTIVEAAGRRFEASVAYPLGSPHRPMTKDQILDKTSSLLHLSSAERRALSGWLDADDVITLAATLDKGFQHE